MTEEFVDLLTDQQKSAGFDLHKFERDSKGAERYTKVDKADVAQKTKVQGMALEVVEATRDQSFAERIAWINDQRKRGNERFGAAEYDAALDEYMKCLCALDFKSCKDEVSEDQAKMADVQMKVPVLNNMAQCMIKKDLAERANDLLDEVLKLAPKNAKATARKLTCMMKLGQIYAVEKEVAYIKNTLDTYGTADRPEDRTLLKTTLQQLERELAQRSEKDKAFSKNIFSKGGLYGDKPDPTEEEEQEETEEERIARENHEEAQYLATLSNFHWFVYPFFKTLEAVCDKVFGCKKHLAKENALRQQQVQERMAAQAAARQAEKEKREEEERKYQEYVAAAKKS